jgi:hypothetical protein
VRGRSSAAAKYVKYPSLGAISSRWTSLVVLELLSGGGGGGGGTPCASYSRERASKLGSMKMGVPASQYMMLTSQLPREPMTAVAAPKAAATSRSGMPR